MIFVYSYLAYMLIVYVGVTLGYHRHFAHYEFKAPPWAQTVMLVCGAVCGGRDPIGWIGIHRLHHKYADTPKDPQPSGWKALFSIWRFTSLPYWAVKDLYKNPRVVQAHRMHKSWWAISALVFLLFGIFETWLIIQALSWIGFGVLNYFGHKDGQPVNAWWLNFIAPGEGAHADHHFLHKGKV